MGPDGLSFRVVVATHAASEKKSRVGLTRSGVVDELFFTNLPRGAFTAADVVALAPPIVGPLNLPLPMKTRNRTRTAGALTPLAARNAGKSSEPRVWNLRLELDHQLSPTPMRTTEFAAALSATSEHLAPASGYAKAEVALPFKRDRFVFARLSPPAGWHSVLSRQASAPSNRTASRS